MRSNVVGSIVSEHAGSEIIADFHMIDKAEERYRSSSSKCTQSANAYNLKKMQRN